MMYTGPALTDQGSVITRTLTNHHGISLETGLIYMDTSTGHSGKGPDFDDDSGTNTGTGVIDSAGDQN
jgi:hypothetical protein